MRTNLPAICTSDTNTQPPHRGITRHVYQSASFQGVIARYMYTFIIYQGA